MAYVYIHKTKDDGTPFYIGISNNDDGYKRAQNTKRRNPYWERVAKKYGFTYEILNEGLSWEEAQEYEKKYIREYKERGYQLTNMTEGGEGTIGYKRPIDGIRNFIEKQAKNKVITVGGLIDKLKKYNPKSPVYLAGIGEDIQNKTSINYFDYISILTRNMVPNDILEEKFGGDINNKEIYDEDFDKCVILHQQSKNEWVEEQFKMEDELKKLNELGDYVEDKTESEMI